MKRTPITETALRCWDDLDPVEAIRRSWELVGLYPLHHFEAQGIIRATMPLLGRALDRMVYGERTVASHEANGEYGRKIAE